MKFKIVKSIIILILVLNYSCIQEKEKCEKRQERIKLCQYLVLSNCFDTDGKINTRGPCAVHGILAPFILCPRKPECNYDLKIILPDTNSEETRE